MFGAEDANQPPRKRRMLTEEQRARVREMNKERMRAACARETPQQTENRRRANREAMRAARARQTPQETHLRRQADNEATRSVRAQETPGQSRRRRQSVNDATAVRRRIASSAPSTAPAAAYVHIGNMDVESKKLSRAPIHGRTKGWKFIGQSHPL